MRGRGWGEGSGLCLRGRGSNVLLLFLWWWWWWFVSMPVVALCRSDCGLILEGAEVTERGILRLRVGLLVFLFSVGLPHNCSAERWIFKR